MVLQQNAILPMSLPVARSLAAIGKIPYRLFNNIINVMTRLNQQTNGGQRQREDYTAYL